MTLVQVGIFSERKDLKYMKIDSFLEKILENNDSLVFGTNNVSNKKC